MVLPYALIPFLVFMLLAGIYMIFYFFPGPWWKRNNQILILVGIILCYAVFFSWYYKHNIKMNNTEAFAYMESISDGNVQMLSCLVKAMSALEDIALRKPNINIVKSEFCDEQLRSSDLSKALEKYINSKFHNHG